MLFNLNEIQVNNLKQIINQAQIVGASAPAIVELLNILSNPLPEPPKAETLKQGTPEQQQKGK